VTVRSNSETESTFVERNVTKKCATFELKNYGKRLVGFHNANERLVNREAAISLT